MATSNKGTQPIDERSNESPAHGPGHKKINLKGQFSEDTGDKSRAQNASAMNNMANSDRIMRNESPQRRIITGAALGKTGQRNKE